MCVDACRLPIVCALQLTGAVCRGELPAPELAIPEVIDSEIDKALAAQSSVAAPQADPETLLRRLTLDLAGRIPTVAERDGFLALPEEQRATLIVDRFDGAAGLRAPLAEQFA
jgi:hypothetical protein